MGDGSRRIRTRIRQVEILFVFQSLAGRSISNPIVVVLVELQDPFKGRNQYSQTSGERSRQMEASSQRHQRSRHNLNDLDPLVNLLAVITLAIVPTDLSFQPFQCGV